MTGYRRVDITTNSLQYLDDSNMLQYGLFNSDDMRDFLIKLSNYDFRQANRVRTFICYCPSYGLLTVKWYSQIASSMDTTAPIFQIYCKDFPNLVYVFEFPCDNSKLHRNNTNMAVTSPSILLTHQMIKNYDDLRVENQSQAGDSLSYAAGSTNANLYYLLFLLLIPIVLVFVFFFICCCGRCCQVFTAHSCNLLVCPCMRPNDRSLFNGREKSSYFICYFIQLID